MVWIWLSTAVILIGAELDAEMEHQTAREPTSMCYLKVKGACEDRPPNPASRCGAQLTFCHHALVRLARIPQAVLDFAVALRQDCGDHVSTARNVQMSGGPDEDCVTNLELLSRHDAVDR